MLCVQVGDAVYDTGVLRYSADFDVDDPDDPVYDTGVLSCVPPGRPRVLDQIAHVWGCGVVKVVVLVLCVCVCVASWCRSAPHPPTYHPPPPPHTSTPRRRFLCVRLGLALATTLL